MVDDEPDVEVLFRQQFRRDLRAGRYAMEFAQSGTIALQRSGTAFMSACITYVSLLKAFQRNPDGALILLMSPTAPSSCHSAGATTLAVSRNVE